MGWIDRFAKSVSPKWALERMRTRLAYDLLARHYEAASTGRRTQGWRRTSGDAEAVAAGSLSRLRDHANDLVRNNPHASSAVSTVADHVVGWGIVPSTTDRRATRLWEEWGETTACDADGRSDFYGLEKLMMRTVAVSGECLVRRRIRKVEDDLPIPIQIQVLEPDYIDTSKTGIRLPNGGEITSGVEFDAIGRRVAYWLFPEHPGSNLYMAAASRRVSAENIVHVFQQLRPGQVRGVSWFAPVILALKDFDEYVDAQLMKQKIAACLAAIYTDPNGAAGGLGVAMAGEIDGEGNPGPEWDSLGPGAILTGPPGRDVEIVQPPRVAEFAQYSEVSLRMIATGFGVNYEDLTGDYTELPFSAARMSRLRHWARVEGWRWQTMVPQACQPVWRWAMQAGMIMNRVSNIPNAEWTAPPLPMIDPDKEGLANTRLVRSGLQSLSETLRERGYNPETVLAELARDFERLDALGLVLDIDPRKMTQAGQAQAQSQEPDSDSGEPMNGEDRSPRSVRVPKKRKEKMNGKQNQA